jgi:adenine-specific DNA methylase
MSIETRFDVGLVAAMALKEKQIQQNFRPIIAVHKWFARRPGTLFRGLILSEFADGPLADCFFKTNSFPGRAIADPFMGGGTPLLEANRVGCDVSGFDINPMAAWIVREEIEHLDVQSYRRQSHSLTTSLKADIGTAYLTDCPLYGERNVPAKYYLWVKTIDCERCAHAIDLFPSHLIADDTRHPRHVFVCAGCGELNEIIDRKQPGQCHHCHAALKEHGPADVIAAPARIADMSIVIHVLT